MSVNYEKTDGFTIENCVLHGTQTSTNGVLSAGIQSVQDHGNKISLQNNYYSQSHFFGNGPK